MRMRMIRPSRVQYRGIGNCRSASKSATRARANISDADAGHDSLKTATSSQAPRQVCDDVIFVGSGACEEKGEGANRDIDGSRRADPSLIKSVNTSGGQDAVVKYSGAN